MNIIWGLIIIVGLTYGFCNNNVDNLIEEIFNVPQYSLSLLLVLFSILVIWNSLFKILEECNVLMVILRPVNFILKKVFKDETEEVIQLISMAFSINCLGLGIASMPYIIEAINKCKRKNNNRIVLLNICPITIFPSTLISIRAKYDGETMIVFLGIILLTFIMFIINLSLFKLKDLDYE